MLSILKYLQQLNTVFFISTGVFLIVFTSVFLGYFVPANSFDNPTVDLLREDSKLMLFVVGVLLTPFIETLLFQSLPFYLSGLLFKHKRRLFFYIIVSSLFFGLMHSYNVYYCIMGVYIGVVLSFFYYIVKLRKQNAVILIFIIHAFNNLLSFLISI